jgi:hypothetical protein
MDPWIGESLKRLVGKREMPTSTFNAFFFETLNKRDYVALFGLGNLELRQGRGGMTEEHIPVAIADAHASVDEQHIGPPALAQRKSMSSCFSRMTPSSPRCAQKRPSCGSALSLDSRSLATAAIALYPPRRS